MAAPEIPFDAEIILPGEERLELGITALDLAVGHAHHDARG